MEQFWDEIDNEDVHVRDMWQFEFKSEVFPNLKLKENRYIQEFFLFVPNSLQINRSTYSKAQFYEDQTNLIRYKTPEFSFSNLLDSNNSKSPLNRIFILCDLPHNQENKAAVEDELKLLANIIRSSLRNQTRRLIFELERTNHDPLVKEFVSDVELLCQQLQQLKEELKKIEKCIKTWNSPLLEKYFSYTEEFISNSINHYLVGLLEVLRLKQDPEAESLDRLISNLLIEEQLIQDKKYRKTLSTGSNQTDNEYIVYRNSLLDKFVLDALLLNINRISLDVKFQNWIGAISAGIAMLVYILFFIWLGTVFLINSQPFLLLTVIIYILKDRIKDGIKILSYHHAFKWFSDYTTEIQAPDHKHTLGVLKETFTFVDENDIPEEIRRKREKEFHTVLKEYQRSESVIYYKKTVLINKPLKGRVGRRHGLNIIFRFNIHRFLLKASNPYEPYSAIDPETSKLIHLPLPKVYHLNLIIKNTSFTKDGKPIVEFKNLRLIIDKNGIKRVEQVNVPFI